LIAHNDGLLIFSPALPVMKETPEAIQKILKVAENRRRVEAFLKDFVSFWQNQLGS
jgi:hypothetical protein